MNKHNVIIVGAGPAGLECANQLSESNLSVLLIERNKIIGPKVCAGGLTYLIKDFNIPKEYTRKFIKYDCYLNGKKFEINSVNYMKTISRYDLGQWQLEKIKNSNNIKILTGVSVKSIKKNKIITNQGDYHFDFLVGADGSNSIVRKYLGLASKFCIGLCYDIDKISNKLILSLNYNLLNFGYIWEFPHKKYINIGVFFNPKNIKSSLAKNILEDYLKKNNYNFSFKNIKGGVFNYNYCGCIFDNIFLIGDAAGLILKTTGEGISLALISGREIGKKIIDPNYKMVKLKKILRLKRRCEILLNLLSLCPFLNKFFIFLFIKHWFRKLFLIKKFKF